MRTQLQGPERKTSFRLLMCSVCFLNSLAVIVADARAVPINDVANGDWNVGGTWDSGVPASGDDATVDSHTVTIPAAFDLTGANAPDSITVATGGIVSQATGTTVDSPITLSGGIWDLPGLNSGTRTTNGTITLSGPDSLTRGPRGTTLIVNGLVTGTGKLNVQSTDSFFATAHRVILNSTNDYSGGTELIPGGTARPVHITAAANRALGSGAITVDGNSTIKGSVLFNVDQDYSQSGWTGQLGGDLWGPDHQHAHGFCGDARRENRS